MVEAEAELAWGSERPAVAQDVIEFVRQQPEAPPENAEPATIINQPAGPGQPIEPLPVGTGAG